MGFESPEVLFGLAGAAIPLVIHFLLRRRARVVPLDSVMALVLSEGVAAVRLRWVHRALLAVRMLLVALTVVAFARPFVVRPAEPGLAAEHPMALGLVLDDSLSMRVAWEGTTSWERARERALSVLEEVPPESEVFVALAGRPASIHPLGGPGWDGRSAARFVSRLAPSLRSTDLAEAMRLAADAVRASPHRDRRVVVVSDFAGPASPGLPEDLAGVEWVPVVVAPPGPVRNATVVAATASPAPDVSPGHARVQVSVRNDGPEAVDPVVTVRLGLHSAARKVACGPGATCEQEFLLLADPGVRSGEVRLPPDDLNDDNLRYFTLEARDRNAILLVNGAPRRQRDLDEPFFLERALRLRAGDHPGFSVQTVVPDQLSALHLSTVAVVGLLNVARLPAGPLEALGKFVETGGGLLITSGENAEGESWAASFGGLLPGPTRDLVDFGEGVPIRWVDPDHPLCPGPGPHTGTFLTARVREVGVLEPGWPPRTRVLATLSSGLPLLVERPVGRGMVLVWLSSVDRDWTDLPLRPGFAPFVRSLFAYLSRAAGSQPSASLVVGEPRSVEVTDHALTVVPPGGREVRFDQSGEFRSTDTPGVYRVEAVEGGETRVRDVFVVNVDPSEGMFRNRDTPPLPLARGGLVRGLGATGESSSGSGRPVRKVPLATYLVGVLLGLFLLESWIRAEA